jgi:hypothetical protein
MATLLFHGEHLLSPSTLLDNIALHHYGPKEEEPKRDKGPLEDTINNEEDQDDTDYVPPDNEDDNSSEDYDSMDDDISEESDWLEEDDSPQELSNYTDLPPTHCPVTATCLLATPFNTNETPMEMKISEIQVTPGWMAYADLTVSTHYNKVVKTVSIQTLYDVNAPNVYKVLNNAFQRVYGTKNPSLKVTPATASNPLSAFELKIGSKVKVKFSESLRVLLNLPHRKYENHDKTQFTLQIKMDHSRATETYAVQSEQVTATYHQNRRQERYCSILHLVKPNEINEAIVLAGSDSWVPLDATLHLDKINLYLSSIHTPGQAIQTKSYKLFITGQIRPQLQQ